MDLFKTASADTNKQQDQQKTQQNKQESKQETNPGTLPGKDVNNPENHTENPFDTYQKLFDNAATKSDITAPNFSLDPKVIAEASNKMDFVRGLSPELMQKATSGDANAMIQLIQEVGRRSYRASLEHTTKLTDTHLGQRAEFESKRLQKGVKEQLTNDALSSNANFSHPVIKAELNRIAKQFAASDEYADASPQQIAEAAKKYLNDLHAAMNPADPKKDKDGKDKPAEIDYMKYLGG
jgi:hypothetical protein